MNIRPLHVSIGDWRRPLVAILGVTIAFWLTLPATADERVPAGGVRAPNAAVIYWQAFAAIPTFNDTDRQKIDAATASTSAPWSEDIGPLLARYRVALHELHRARSVTPCDWQLDHEAGPHLLLPHLQKARELSRIALLRARVRLAAGESTAALDDLLAVMKLARDCGTDSYVISLLVQIAIEKSATEVLSAHLPQFQDTQLELMESSLAHFSQPLRLETTIQAEKKLFSDWLERRLETEVAKLGDPKAGGTLLAILAKSTGSDTLPKNGQDDESKRRIALLNSLAVDDVRRCVTQLRADYDELASIAGLPANARNARIKQFEAVIAQSTQLQTRSDVDHYFSTIFLPTLRNVLTREEQYRVRNQLFLQALEIQQSGSQTAKPIEGREVTLEKKDSGFELRCPTSAGVEVIRVGKS